MIADADTDLELQPPAAPAAPAEKPPLSTGAKVGGAVLALLILWGMLS